MIAIWPAGPPKLMHPSFSQNRTASSSLGRIVVAGLPAGSPVAAALSVASP